MKIVKFSLILVAAVAAIIGLSTASYAFHSGGVAECMGCHAMHSGNGLTLLVGTDASSTCLTCHGKTGASSYHILTPDADMPAGIAPGNMSPGGDFGWLKKTYTYSAHGESGTDKGDHHGHNIIALDNGLAVDSDNGTAPGGTFNANNLACSSCHDQHGQVRRSDTATFSTSGAPIIGSGSYDTSVAPTPGQAVGTYRLLRSNLSNNIGAATGANFTNSPVVAFAPGTYNRSEGITMTRVEYNSGMTDYCSSCHSAMHAAVGTTKHPAGVPIGSMLNNYNTYVKSGDMSGSSANSYLSLVPFEEGMTVNVANIAALQLKAKNNDTQLGGPTATAQVMCLSCHRAHASAFPEMTRWENESEFIVSNSLYPAVNGKTTPETLAAYYGKPATKFATYQRSLCNKCHAKD